MVADLDEKLSDCGPRDVEGGSPHSSPPGSDQEDSGSDKEEESGRREGGSRASPDTSQGGRKNLFLAGMQEVGRSLPLVYCFAQL